MTQQEFNDLSPGDEILYVKYEEQFNFYRMTVTELLYKINSDTARTKIGLLSMNDIFISEDDVRKKFTEHIIVRYFK